MKTTSLPYFTLPNVHLIAHYLTENTIPHYDSAAAILLAANYVVDAGGMLASTGNYTDALTLIESYEPTSKEELDEKTLMEMYLSLLANGDKWDAIDSSQLQQVNDLSTGVGPAAARAKIILGILNDSDIIPQIPSYNESGQRIASGPKRNYKVTNYFTFTNDAQLSIKPNPIVSEATVTYRFPSQAIEPMLVIRDITGKQMFAKTIAVNENTQTIETSNLQQGVYRMQLMDGSLLLKSIPLVIIK